MHAIQFEFPLSVGLDGVDTSAINPLSRALSALLANGIKHKAQALCFLNIADESNSSNPQHWLGVFIHSTGNRILFFPGLNIPLDWIEVVRNGLDPIRHKFNIDHFSAEPARKRWHFTGTNSENHLAGGRTREADKESYFWMGLSFQNHLSFLPLYKRNFVTHNAAASDMGRRMNLMKELEKTTKYVQVNIENQENSKFKPSFLHMCFIFSKPSAPTYTGSELLLPFESPYLTSSLPDIPPDSKLWRNRVPLSDSWEIQITTMFLPGTIPLPFIFTSPASLGI